MGPAVRRGRRPRWRGRSPARRAARPRAPVVRPPPPVARHDRRPRARARSEWQRRVDLHLAHGCRLRQLDLEPHARLLRGAAVSHRAPGTVPVAFAAASLLWLADSRHSAAFVIARGGEPSSSGSVHDVLRAHAADERHLRRRDEHPGIAKLLRT